MRSALFASFCLSLCLFARSQTAYSQVPATGAGSNAAGNELRYDIGTINGGTYTNDCFGLSIGIPSGWSVSNLQGNAQGKAAHMPGGALDLLLLQKGASLLESNKMSLSAGPVREPTMSAEDVLNRSAQAQVAIDPVKRQVTRLAFPVSYGGRQFYRVNYKQSMSNSFTLYVSYVLTKFRGYYIEASLVAKSPEQLDEAADLLKTISFKEDVVNPKCTIGPDEFAGQVGIIGGIVRGPSAQRIRVSMSVSQALLLTKVDPEYPEAARQTGVHGSVVLSVIVGPNGEVQQATAIAGDPSLVPAAIAAVKQWKYKPYLLAGQPVTVDTTVKVDFAEQK